MMIGVSSKHVEPLQNFGIINSITKLHLVGISTVSPVFSGQKKHVEPLQNFGIINSITKLHLVGISTVSPVFRAEEMLFSP